MAGTARERRQKREATPSGFPLRFLLTALAYAVLVLVFSVLFLSPLVFGDLMKEVRELVASLASSTLSLVGMPVASRGQIITGPGTPLMIVNECTGIDATILVVAAVLVFPASWRQRLLGVGMAIGVMMGVNFVRILTLIYIGSYHRAWLDVGHLYVWPVIVILAGVGTLLFWAERFATPRPA